MIWPVSLAPPTATASPLALASLRMGVTTPGTQRLLRLLLRLKLLLQWLKLLLQRLVVPLRGPHRRLVPILLVLLVLILVGWLHHVTRSLPSGP